MTTTSIADRPAISHKRWTPDELECLNDKFGLIADRTLARRLNRTEKTVISKARYYRIRATDNFSTARALAEVLGISCSHTILRWVKKGWLKGKRSGKSHGKHRLWCFTIEAVEEFLRQHPWLVDMKTMERHYFRSIIKEEWDRDPWYTIRETAALLGLKNRNTVSGYISQGWLKAEKTQGMGGKTWVIRRSAIRTFLENDPRPAHLHAVRREAMKSFSISSGIPQKYATIWFVKCPACGQRVMTRAHPELRGYQVQKRFVELYVNGTCGHTSECLIPWESEGPPLLSSN